MGNYIFSREVLVEALHADAADEGSGHGIGSDIMPRLVREGAAHVYDFLQNKVPGAAGQDHGYWREVGTLDSYFAAHMDLCAVLDKNVVVRAGASVGWIASMGSRCPRAGSPWWARAGW